MKWRLVEMRKLSAAVLLIMLFSQPVSGQDRIAPPTIAVNGNGEVRIAPDQATVRLGISHQARTAQEAQQQVNTVAQAILAAIQKVGVERGQIQTSQLTLYPVYSDQGPIEPMRRGEPRVVGYRAANVVSVTVNQLQLVGPVIDAGLTAGANQLEGVSFELQDDLAARQQALGKAAAEARSKARTIADALGVQLGDIEEAVEGGVSVSPVMARAEMMMARDVSTPVAPGEVVVGASLTVRYRISR
jgi:uncharacterized protein